MRRLRILTHVLIVSGTLNIALLATFVIHALRGEKKARALPFALEVAQRSHPTNEAELQSLARLTFEELLTALSDSAHIEEGQRRCDLALAILSSFYEFDVERALAGYFVKKKELRLNSYPLTLFIGLQEEGIERIRRFAEREMWPLTPKGLFFQMQGRQEIPPSLKQAFSLTAPYFSLKRAFSRRAPSLSEEQLFQLIVEGEWEEIEHFGGSVQEVGPLLLSRIRKGSKVAAHLMASLEQEFALKRLDDSELKQLLSLLEKSAEVEPFLEALSQGMRSHQVDKVGASLSPPPTTTYIVKHGDSLWKISRQFEVTIAAIKERNALTSDRLKLGMELSIPAKERAKEGDHLLPDAKGGISKAA